MTDQHKVSPDVTFGVNCTGNVHALTLCLSSVLMGFTAPSRIQVRMEGQLPSFADFYLEQMASFAAIQGIEFTLTHAVSRGVRKARDWQMENCRTSLLWMGDDDCIYAPPCLAVLLHAFEHAQGLAHRNEKGEITYVGYINGAKPDINNRRGYGDFAVTQLPTEGLQNGASMNQFYKGPFAVVRTNTMDTGNVLLNLPALFTKGMHFDKFGESFNCGGEDTLMGLHANSKEAYGYFAPTATAIHLEKPRVQFNEFAARGEVIRLSCQKLGVPLDGMKEFMPWLKTS